MTTLERLAFAQLATNEEIDELRALLAPSTMPEKAAGLRLKRTFNQKGLDGSVTKFWRVMGPLNCANLGSDLSLKGLKNWKLIP